MPIVEMPDNTQVQFPDDMPREQIKSLILKKYPNLGIKPESNDIRDFAMSHLPDDLQGYAANGLKALQGLNPAQGMAQDTVSGLMNGGWQKPQSGYSPYKPADPNNMPNDAINPVGSDSQMAAAIGATGMGRMVTKGIPQVANEAKLASQAGNEIAPTVATKAGKESIEDFNARIRALGKANNTIVGPGIGKSPLNPANAAPAPAPASIAPTGGRSTMDKVWDATAILHAISHPPTGGPHAMARFGLRYGPQVLGLMK